MRVMLYVMALVAMTATAMSQDESARVASAIEILTDDRVEYANKILEAEMKKLPEIDTAEAFNIDISEDANDEKDGESCGEEQCVKYQIKPKPFVGYTTDKCCCETIRSSFRPRSLYDRPTRRRWTVYGNTWVTIGKCTSPYKSCGCSPRLVGQTVDVASAADDEKLREGQAGNISPVTIRPYPWLLRSRCTQQYQYHRFLVYTTFPRFQYKYITVRLPDFCQCKKRTVSWPTLGTRPSLPTFGTKPTIPTIRPTREPRELKPAQSRF